MASCNLLVIQTTSIIMFSSLLSRPVNSSYDPSYHFSPVPREIKNDPTSNGVVSTTKNATPLAPSKYDTTIPLKKRYPNLVHNFPKPELDENVILETKKVIDSILNPSDEPTNDINYIKYENPNPNPNHEQQQQQQLLLQQQQGHGYYYTESSSSAIVDDDDYPAAKNEFMFEEDFIPGSLSDVILTPQELKRRDSRSQSGNLNVRPSLNNLFESQTQPTHDNGNVFLMD